MAGAIVPLATSLLARVGITGAGRVAGKGLLSSIGGWLKNALFGSKLKTGLTALAAGHMLGSSSSGSSAAAAQVRQYRA